MNRWKCWRGSRYASEMALGLVPEILDAIDVVTLVEARNRLFDEADRRYAVIAETGQTIPWSKMRRYLERRPGRGRDH